MSFNDYNPKKARSQHAFYSNDNLARKVDRSHSTVAPSTRRTSEKVRPETTPAKRTTQRPHRQRKQSLVEIPVIDIKKRVVALGALVFVGIALLAVLASGIAFNAVHSSVRDKRAENETLKATLSSLNAEIEAQSWIDDTQPSGSMNRGEG